VPTPPESSLPPAPALTPRSPPPETPQHETSRPLKWRPIAALQAATEERARTAEGRLVAALARQQELADAHVRAEADLAAAHQTVTELEAALEGTRADSDQTTVKLHQQIAELEQALATAHAGSDETTAQLRAQLAELEEALTAVQARSEQATAALGIQLVELDESLASAREHAAAAELQAETGSSELAQRVVALEAELATARREAEHAGGRHDDEAASRDAAERAAAGAAEERDALAARLEDARAEVRDAEREAVTLRAQLADRPDVSAAAAEREAALTAEIDQLRSAAQQTRVTTSPASQPQPSGEELLDFSDDADISALLAPEAHRERLIVFALLFVAVLAGVAIATSGLIDVVH
jgi:chromosome segregation ATPase